MRSTWGNPKTTKEYLRDNCRVALMTVTTRQQQQKQTQKYSEGTSGFEPLTYRTAADCSTTELYPHDVGNTLKCLYEFP